MKEIKPRAEIDKSLKSGERQVAHSIVGIEKWHLWRYEQALKYITDKDSVVDLGCGVGYGTNIISWKAKEVYGYDDSKEAIEFAAANYARINTFFRNEDILTLKKQFDVAVAFEILEHIQHEEKFFEAIKNITKKYIILSTPHITIDATPYPFHYRHYKLVEVVKLLEDAGFKIIRKETPKFARGLAVFCVGEKIC